MKAAIQNTTLLYFLKEILTMGLFLFSIVYLTIPKVLLENGWNSRQMITEGEAVIPLETTLHAFRNREKTKQRSTIITIMFCAAQQ